MAKSGFCFSISTLEAARFLEIISMDREFISILLLLHLRSKNLLNLVKRLNYVVRVVPIHGWTHLGNNLINHWIFIEIYRCLVEVGILIWMVRLTTIVQLA